MIPPIATMNRMRSTVGSNILPNSLVWFSRRASHPSTQSVAPSPPSNHAAPATVVETEQHVQEQRDAAQPEQGERVGNRQVAIRCQRFHFHSAERTFAT